MQNMMPFILTRHDNAEPHYAGLIISKVVKARNGPVIAPIVLYYKVDKRRGNMRPVILSAAKDLRSGRAIRLGNADPSLHSGWRILWYFREFHYKKPIEEKYDF